MFHYSDTWQLVINTGTTIITFLMVFLIQNTQSRDAKAIHLKLDELIKGVKGARTGLVNLENLSDEELGQLQEQFTRLHTKKNKGMDPTRQLICDSYGGNTNALDDSGDHFGALVGWFPG